MSYTGKKVWDMTPEEYKAYSDEQAKLGTKALREAAEEAAREKAEKAAQEKATSKPAKA